jgi:hypothetical protein
MQKNTIFSTSVVLLVSLALFSSAFVGIVSNETKYIPANDKAVDDIIYEIPQITGTRAGTERTVLAEYFTSWDCSFCANGDPAIDQLGDEYGDRLAVIIYHVWWPGGGDDPYYLANVADNTDRANYYAVSSEGVPYLKTDGTLKRVGAGSPSGAYSNYKTDIESRMPILSPLSISVSGRIDSGTGYVNAYIEATDPTPGVNLQVRMGVTEDNLYEDGGSNDINRHRFVMRDMLTEQTLSGFNMGSSTWVNRTFTVDPGWNQGNLNVVVFVQRDDTQEVIQSGMYDYVAQPILVVDDDESSQPLGYEDDHHEILCKMGYSFDGWVVSVVGGPSEAVLAKYEAVIWLTGTTSTNTLTTADQTAISNYLDNGKGSLFLLGEDIGADIGSTPFFQNYLQANFVTDSTGDSQVTGVKSDPITDIFFGVNLPIMTGSPSEVTPIPPATTIFTYTSSGKSAAVKAEHDLDSRIAYFAFMYFEGTDTDSNKMLVMERVIDWLIIRVNSIVIRDAPGDAGNIVKTLTMYSSETITLWAAAYNDTLGFLANYLITIWFEDSGGAIITVTTPGSSTLLTALFSSGVANATADCWGLQSSVVVTVNPPGIDYVQIRDAPGGAGNDLGIPANYPSYPVGYLTTFYAAAYNYTFDYLFEIDSLWMSSDDTIVGVTTPGLFTAITCSDTNSGTVTITVIENTLFLMNTTSVTVIPPTMDYIEIVDAPGGLGNIVNTLTYSAFDTDDFYAAGFNSTAGYLSDVSVDWTSDDPLIGSVLPGPGIQTTFTAQQVALDSTCTVTATWGGFSDSTGLLTVLGPNIDYILIRDAPGGAGNVVGTRTFAVSDTDTFYAAGYNNTVLYLADVAATWSSDDPGVGDVLPKTGTQTTFTAEQVPSDSTCSVTALFAGVSDSTDLLTVLAPTVDEIRIRDAAGGLGNEVNTLIYIIWETDTFYAAAYNDTVDYLTDVSCDWVSDDPTVGQVSTPGASTTFTAQDVPTDSTCTITATYGIFTDTTDLLTVLASTIDEIKIRDAPGGGGSEVTIDSFVVFETTQFYAAAYNFTTLYLTDVVVTWSSDDPLVGDVLPGPGIVTTFTAQQVPTDATCQITADYGGIMDSTGLLTVLAPIVDEIRIRDSPGGIGGLVTTGTYVVQQTDTFYAAGYNGTVDYLNDVVATWSSDDTTVGDISPASGTQTTFNAKEVPTDSTCTITATYLSYSYSTDLLTVLSPRIDYIRIVDAPSGSGAEVDTGSYVVLETDEFYTAAYNNTVDYIFDVEAQWQSDDNSIGTVDLLGFSSTFTAQQTASDLTCIISAGYLGHFDSTGPLTVLAPTVDYIVIEDGPLGTGSAVTTATYNGYDKDTFYAAGYNNTVSYLYDVVSDWDCNPLYVGEIVAQGLWANFTAQGLSSDGACIITATYGTLTDSAGLLSVLAMPPLTVDYIVIMDAKYGAGNPIWEYSLWPGESYTYFSVGDTLTLWAAGFNESTGVFVEDVTVTWSTLDILLQPDNLNATVIEGPAKSTTLTINSENEGALFVKAENTNLGISNSTDMLVINPPKADYIEIRDAPGGLGNIVDNAIYIVNQVDEFYAAAYNNTANYIGDVDAQWTSDDVDVGTVSASFVSTTFTAQEVSVDSSCTVSATYLGMTQETGLLNVVIPTIDEIRIRDSENGEGSVISDLSYDAEDTDTFYAAAYNNTLGYLYDIEAIWSCDPGTSAEIVSEGPFATFTALTLSAKGTCTVTAGFLGISNSTGILTINAFVDDSSPERPSQPTLEILDHDSIKLTWMANSEEDLNKYIIQRAERQNGPWKDIDEVDKGRTTYTDKDLKPGTMYYYRIIAVDDAGNPSEESRWMGKETYVEMPWLFLLLILIIISVILVAAVATRRKNKKIRAANLLKQKQTEAASAQAAAKPSPPRSRSSQKKSEGKRPPPSSKLQKNEVKAPEKPESDVDKVPDETPISEDEMLPPPPPED